ncbi:MAG: hypothetical protein QXL96_06275 [Ignisphaera sp.]
MFYTNTSGVYIKRKIIDIVICAILIALMYTISFNYLAIPNAMGEIIYSSRIDIPPGYYVFIPINLNPKDVINGTFRSLSTCVVELCIDVTGFVLDPNNNVVAVFRINYTKPIARFSFETLDGGTFRIILVNLLTFEAYTELKLERVKGIYPTPPKVIIPTTTIYSTITSTIIEEIPITITTYSTSTVEKTIAILLPTTITITTTDTIVAISTLQKTYTVTQTQQFTIALSTTLHKITTLTVTEYKTIAQTQLLEVYKTLYVPSTITTIIEYTKDQIQNLVKIGISVALIAVIISSTLYIAIKTVKKK